MSMETSVVFSPLKAYPQDGWNQTAQDYPQGKTLASLFERQVARTPDATAVRCGADRLNYLALNARANQLAHHLRQWGAGPGAVIGIHLPRSIDMLVAVLAALKAGAAYLPLDSAAPPDELASRLSGAGCRWLICRAPPPAFEGQAILIEASAAAIAAEASTNPVPLSSAENAACLLYVSRSNDGRGNGVRIANRSVVNLLHGLRAHLQIWRGDVLLALAPLSADAAVIDIFVPLCSGACVAILPQDVAPTPQRLAAALVDSAATIVQAPPSMWRALLEAGLPEVRHVTALVTGGALPQALGHALAERAGSVWALYGCAETTVASIIAPFRECAVQAGRPLANTQAFILDDELWPLPRGEVGDLYIGGDGLALDSFASADLGTRRFIENPFAGHASERLYKTGDRARYTEHGEIQVLDRVSAEDDLAESAVPASPAPAHHEPGVWNRTCRQLQRAVRQWLHRPTGNGVQNWK
jgi:non-ribosomal peptide synthetase component F